MSIRAHRIIKIVYAEASFFKQGSALHKALIDHEDTNDLTNQDGGGNIEFPFRVLKEIYDNSLQLKLEPYDVELLMDEIRELDRAGKDDDEYIIYDMY